jgi:hypothetical protein
VRRIIRNIRSRFWREGLTIDVQDQVVLLRSGDSLNGDGIVEEFVGREVLHHVFLDQLDTQIRVVSGLNSVTDTRDCRIG